MIQSEFANGVLELRISRPEKRNALSRAMYFQLADALDEIQKNAECNAVIIHGEGGNFTVGADIGDFQEKRGEGDSRRLPARLAFSSLGLGERGSCSR